MSVTFANAQSAGDLIVVIVGWNDTTTQISALSDTNGNTYQLGVGPTQVSGAATQYIVYANNIQAAAAGANTVTVTFTAAPASPDVRILEYSGIDPSNPVDVTAAQAGANSSTTSTNAVTTNYPNDLLVSANYVSTWTIGAGPSFALRLLTSPDGDIAEDSIAATPGSYSASAPLSQAGWWVMQMVAFRAATSHHHHSD
jgi:hypothetical protein